MHVERNVQARSRNHCCRGKEIKLTYFCVCALGCVRTCMCVCFLKIRWSYFLARIRPIFHITFILFFVAFKSTWDLKCTKCLWDRFFFGLPFSTPLDHSSSHTCCSYQNGKRAKLGNLSNSSALSEVGKNWIEKYFHLFPLKEVVVVNVSEGFLEGP